MAKFVKIGDHFINPELVEFIAPTEFDGVTRIVTSNATLRVDIPIDRVLRILQPPVRKGRG